MSKTAKPCGSTSEHSRKMLLSIKNYNWEDSRWFLWEIGELLISWEGYEPNRHTGCTGIVWRHMWPYHNSLEPYSTPSAIDQHFPLRIFIAKRKIEVISKTYYSTWMWEMLWLCLVYACTSSLFFMSMDKKASHNNLLWLEVIWAFSGIFVNHVFFINTWPCLYAQLWPSMHKPTIHRKM